MGCSGNNATPPCPAIAPGADLIDPAGVARGFRVDPRLSAAVPGMDAPFFQAGLAGYSDPAMRILARRHGCPLCVTEALLDRTLLSGGRGFAKADLALIADNVPAADEDHPLIGQLIGSEPDELAAAAIKMVGQARRLIGSHRSATPRVSHPSVPPKTFAAIDVNLACPVKKIRNKARGGHWLRDPEGAINILRAVRDALPRAIPTTLKIRMGSDDSDDARRNFLRIFDAAYDLGYSWATVHARTVDQNYVGPSRWTFLRDLIRARPDRVILGSGDIWSAGDIFRMIAYTGVHAVSVARGCIGNPWVFRQARQLIAGETPAAPTIAEQRAVLREHFDLAAALHGEIGAGLTMRKFGIRFAAHHPRTDDVRRRFIACTTAEDWRRVLDEHYDQQEVACLE